MAGAALDGVKDVERLLPDHMDTSQRKEDRHLDQSDRHLDTRQRKVDRHLDQSDRHLDTPKRKEDRHLASLFL